MQTDLTTQVTEIPSMLTIVETATRFNLPTHMVRQLCVTGTIKTVKAGKKYLINEKLFLDYLNCKTA